MCTFPIQQHKNKHNRCFSNFPFLQMYPLQQHKHKQNVLFPKCLVLHVYIHSTTTQIWIQIIVAKITNLTSVYVFYNNKKIQQEDRFQNALSYMCTYTLEKQNHEHKGSFPKFPVVHLYIPSTTTQAYTQSLVSKIPSLTCVCTLYNNTIINTKACFQNYQSCLCKCPLQKHKNKHSILLPKCPFLHVYIPSKTTQT